MNVEFRTPKLNSDQIENISLLEIRVLYYPTKKPRQTAGLFNVSTFQHFNLTTNN